ncbi:Heavy metal-associated domain [Macleaya cordata]|uniref:Heavy metal-associated domain n=1 Tax=Macleaya cordata TaxID=56857 RepID=A0A200PWJ4_MACCD|nr:Heavy metal-associated domain [Macleaya cordata]
MVPELEKPRIIEIQVRMDCNGCVQKIKKALHGINGIYDVYIDFPQQKLTVVGWADPEKIVKAIKKTRKIIASVCVHTDEASEAPPQAQEPPPPEGEEPPPNTESPPDEPIPLPEPPKDPPPPENPALEIHPSPVAAEAIENQPQHHPGPRDVEEIHVIHHHQHEYGGQLNSYPPETRHGYWSNYPKVHGFRPEPPVYSHVFRPEPPVYVSHSYNTYKPSPYVSEYEYVRSPPRHTRFSRTEHYYSEDYHNHDNGYQNRDNGNGNNITSIFSDENPNACRIV